MFSTDQSCFIYLKTADHCNLSCRHCYTLGSGAVKAFFDPDATIDFLHRLKEFQPEFSNPSISFHGGEAFLAPVEDMRRVWDQCKDLWPDLNWSIQTNLTFPLTEEKESFLEDVCGKSWGTSWDLDIRWRGNLVQESLWEKNLRYLTSKGHEVTVMVCVTKSVVNSDPRTILDKMIDLGVKYINFERITPNGSALENEDIFATNTEMDEWFLKLWEVSLEGEYHKRIMNLFFESILSSLVYNSFSGCRCRECEQKILTLNANGTVGGCPNGAPDKTFGHISDPVEQLWFSEGRMCNIQEEAIRHPLCGVCPVSDICNGDCHQLAWQGPVCAAPKSLMVKMKAERNEKLEVYREVLGDFQGQE